MGTLIGYGLAIYWLSYVIKKIKKKYMHTRT